MIIAIVLVAIGLILAFMAGTVYGIDYERHRAAEESEIRHRLGLPVTSGGRMASRVPEWVRRKTTEPQQ